MIINGDHVWFTGTGILSDGQVVSFSVDIDQSGQSDLFSIHIPTLNGYAVIANPGGGNITIH